MTTVQHAGQQGIDEGRPFFGPNLGKLHLHASQCTKPALDQLRLCHWEAL
jgi:hypothetical protein